MARTFELTDGTTTVSLISLTGIMAARGGLGPTRVRPQLTFDGDRLRDYRILPVAETYRLNLIGASHDDAAAQLQDFLKLLRRAREYNAPETSSWQRTPVYLKSQTTSESSPRYARVLGAADWELPDLFRVPFEADSEIEGMEFTLVREPLWRAQAPEVLPYPLRLSTAFHNSLDVIDASSGTGLSRSEAAALPVGWIGMTGDTTARYFQNRRAISSLKFIVVEFTLDTGALTMTDNTRHAICHILDSGGAARFALELKYLTSGGFRLIGNLVNDTPADNYTSELPITTGEHAIKLIVSYSSIQNDDAGYAKVYVDGVLQATISAIDNDTHEAAGLLVGAVSAVDATTTGVFKVYDIRWADADDGQWHEWLAPVSRWGGAVNISDNTNRYWEFTEPNESEFTCELMFDPNTLAIDSADQFDLLTTTSPGGGGTAFNLTVLVSGGSFRLSALVKTDAGGNLFPAAGNITDAPHLIKCYWKAATSPGANNGIFKLWVDGVLVGSTTAVDNDTHLVTAWRIGATGPDTGTRGTFYVDQLRWADGDDWNWLQQCDFEGDGLAGVPGSLVGNLRQTTKLTHVFNYDNSLTAFSANLVNAHEFSLFSVSGSTPALDDAVYLGATSRPFFNALLRIGTAGVFSATIVLEYWNGATWASGGGLQASYLTQADALVPIVFNNNGKDWATTSVNGVTAYWLRARISAFTSWTTTPTQTGQPISCVNENYAEFVSAQVPGDEAALTLLRWTNRANEAAPQIPSWLAVGLKTRGLDNFISLINPVNENPTGWSVANGTDTSAINSAEAAGGAFARCTFATSQAMVERWEAALNSATAESDFAGAYRVYLRARQTGGAAGDVAVKLVLKSGQTVEGEQVLLTEIDQGVELIDLGRFEIFPDWPRGPESGINVGITFEVHASSSNGVTPDLEIFGLALLPVDEWSLVVREFLPTQYLTVGRGVQIDGGVLREAAHMVSVSFSESRFRPLSHYQVRGGLPAMPPGRKGRLYFLAAAPNSNNVYQAGFGLAGIVQLLTVPGWHHLRGDA